MPGGLEQQTIFKASAVIARDSKPNKDFIFIFIGERREGGEERGGRRGRRGRRGRGREGVSCI